MRAAHTLALAITACLPVPAAERALPAARHAAKRSGWWEPSAASGEQPKAPTPALATPRAGKPPNIVKGPVIEPLRWPDREETTRKRDPWIITVGAR